MSKSLKGSRSSKEASVLLSSVTVVARELDTDGAPTGEERNLGSLTVNKDNGTVVLTTPVGGEEVGDGWQVLLREHGRDSQTHQVKVWFETADVPDPDPEPTPDTMKPSTPANLRVTDITQTGFTLAWDPATDNVDVAKYILGGLSDRQITVTSPHVVAGLESGTLDTFYDLDLWALDAAGNESVPARIIVTTPAVDPDPEPEQPTTGTWPAAGTVGFKGDRALLDPMRSGAIRTAGTVIEGRRIDCSDGELGFRAKNIVLRNCIIECGVWGVYAYNKVAEGLVIEDCTFIGGYQAAIGLEQVEGWTVRRCDFYGGRDAIKPGGRGVIEDCTMHDPDTGGDAHNDCLQFSHTDGVIVRRNYLAGADTSCIAMFEGQGTYKNVTIENNYLGGAGYAIYAGGRTGSNIRILNNTFGSWGYQHPVTDWVRKAGNEFVGNKTVAGVEVKQP